MKKRIISVCVLLTVTLFMFVSCSGSITDTLLKVMDSTNVNVYEKTGMVKPDTSAADNALKAMESNTAEINVDADGIVKLEGDLKDLAVVGEIKLSGKLAEAASNGVLAPQTAEQKAAFTSAINSATNEASQKALKDKMETEVKDPEQIAAVKGTMAVTSGAIDTVVSKLDTETATKEAKQVAEILGGLSKQLAATAIDEHAVITEADKVQAQLLTNIAVSAAKASGALAASAGKENALDDPLVQELVNDTLTLYATAKIASGSVDILQTEGLFDALANNTSGSKAVIEIGSDGMPIELRKLMINLIKNSLGTDPKQYNAKFNSYRNMVESRNLTYAVIGGNTVTDASLKATATTGSVLEFVNAAIFSTLLDPTFPIETESGKFVTFATLLNDIVLSSGEKLFTDYIIEANAYHEFLTAFFNGKAETKNFKSLSIQILKSLVNEAETADKMLKAGGLNVADLLSALKITSSGETIESLSEWLNKLIEDMENNKEEQK